MATANHIESEPVEDNLQRVRTGIDYSSKIQPLVSVCKKENGKDKLKFLLVLQIGKQGIGELEFNYPWGIAINESNDDIYICDYSNNRVQILSQDFLFKSQIGSFTRPRDVKLSKEYIYVLDESNPCIHLFNHNYILQKSVISLRQGNQVINPRSFFIDNSNNILIPDYFSNSICIFNPEFQ
ncbi:PEP-CTERM domain protein [Oopsacas minuta]|uniref:PEP-CTERM domain protein n=1 Tax=Oopsacas minuta TaxID=111878 RepID=A0AAV7JJG3_9METZ|nr:PEP-CTERM domain protein [Oopsacas minuta]